MSYCWCVLLWSLYETFNASIWKPDFAIIPWARIPAFMNNVAPVPSEKTLCLDFLTSWKPHFLLSVFRPLGLHLHLVLVPINFTSHCLHFFLFSLCRASIVQKRIIYFQDEGLLTKRMCEKGRRLLLTLNKSCTVHVYTFNLPLLCFHRTYSLFFLSFFFFFTLCCCVFVMRRRDSPLCRYALYS